ncbi:site-specific integrase [Pedobacter riviphilus]|uniref:Site-specific integrase n=1 Tax=Pedobacter riviphilus TaxID=2766984 RepID=A0ABX6THU3_9SPHI|nr:site-specific integrase [Pedobacter riviphilus]QNR85083.1 site-specific integrase [Pedobacter riviphilus]
MYTTPQISANDNLASRSYVYFYYNKKHYKFYNGNKLNLPIFPNHAKTVKERAKLLHKLQQEYTKALNNNWSPTASPFLDEVLSTKVAFSKVLEEKLQSPYSKFYKRDLKTVCEQFLNSLSKELSEMNINELPNSAIETFLNQFKSSGRHYMNKRRSLSIFFSELVRKEFIGKNPVIKTPKQKAKAKLHEIYKDEQLNNVLNYLMENHYNLYLCSLITYGCLLRPHQEVRFLTKKHISDDFTKFNLSGAENKSGRVRTVFIPSYLKEVLLNHLKEIENLDSNIFTLTNEPFNDDYFKTQWSRAKTQMLKIGLISKNQTLYSFRHTAAVKVYRKSKDLSILQQLLGHSNMIVTLKYLRGLGEATNEELKDVMPELALF